MRDLQPGNTAEADPRPPWGWLGFRGACQEGSCVLGSGVSLGESGAGHVLCHGLVESRVSENETLMRHLGDPTWALGPPPTAAQPGSWWLWGSGSPGRGGGGEGRGEGGGRRLRGDTCSFPFQLPRPYGRPRHWLQVAPTGAGVQWRVGWGRLAVLCDGLPVPSPGS